MMRMPGRNRLRALWGRIRRRAHRVRLPAGLKRTLLIACACAVVALLTAGGLPVLRRLYVMGWIAGKHYQIAFAALCVVPAAAVHWAAAHSGRRGAAWWTVWLPGIVVYAAFPWRKTVTWEALGIFGPAWDWARTIFLHWNTAPPDVFNNFGAFVAMLAVTIVAVGKLWLGAGKAVARLGPDTAAAPEDVLPNAAWASRGEVVERFSAPGGIVLGELTDPVEESPDFVPDRAETWGGQGHGQLITLSPTDGNGHVLVTSQASGYKSTGLVIPNILTYDDPIVVFDPKCELYARTRKAREDMEFTPVVIDAEHGFDPARLIAALGKDHPSVYRRMAKMMIPQGHSGIENAQYFKDAAVNLLTALLAHQGETGSPNILQDIAQMLSQSPDEVFSEIEEQLADSKLAIVTNELNALQGMDPKYWYSVKTEITNQLSFASLPDVERYITTSDDSPLPSQVIDPKCDIFLNIPQHVAEDFAPMLRLMLGSLLTAAQFVEVNEDPRCRRLFLIDEAAKLGAMDILENIRDRGRSLGLHLMMFYQTPGEIEKLWGRAAMTSWRDGCSATIMGPVSSRDSAGEISAMIGTRTLRVRTESTSSSSQVMSPMAGQVSVSEQEQLRDVPLISPTAVSQLPRHASIIKVPGEKPILASKAIWFARKSMKGRVRNTDEIKDELAVTRTQKEMLARLAKMTRSGGEGRKPAPPGPEPEAGQRGAGGAEADAAAADDDARQKHPARLDSKEHGPAQVGEDGLERGAGEDAGGGSGHPEAATAVGTATDDGPDAGETASVQDCAAASRTAAEKSKAERDADKGGPMASPSEMADDGPAHQDTEGAVESAKGAVENGEDAIAGAEAERFRSPGAGNAATVQDGVAEAEIARSDFAESRPPADESEGKPAPGEDAGDGSGHPEGVSADKAADGDMDAMETASAVDGSVATDAPAPDSAAEPHADRAGIGAPTSEGADPGPGDPETAADAGDPGSARPEPREGEVRTSAPPSMDGDDGPAHRGVETDAARKDGETRPGAAKSGEVAAGSTSGAETAPPARKADDGLKHVPLENGSGAVLGDDGGGDWSAEESRRALEMLYDGLPAEEIARALDRGLADTEVQIKRMGRSAMVPGGNGAADGGEP